MPHQIDLGSEPGLRNWAIAVDGCMVPVTVKGARLQENDREMLTLTDRDGKVVFRAAWGRVQYLRRHDPEPDLSGTILLPGYMTREGAYHITHLGAGFTEIFPGLEGAVFLPADDKGKLTAHFRLTPRENDDAPGR